ncbi:MAG: hypothetical protein CSA49_07440 [Gammaproteobacteria bacterium]|nr:MAG: hypothetical protein CSA49_07440 [Gammaproteobacteria bacterium]
MKGATFLLIFVLLSVSGCTTNSQNDRSKISTPDSLNSAHDSINLEHKIYGKLEKQGDGYFFTEFSETYRANQPWVRLTDMKPMWDTSKEDCLTGIVEITNKDITCKTGNEKLFRTKGTDFTVKKTAGYVFFSVLSLGAGAPMPPGAVKFNWKKYLSSTKEAKSRLVDNHLTLMNEYNAEMSKFNQIYNKVAHNYKNAANPTPNINLHDKSGLFGNNASAFKNYISVSKNIIPSKDDVGYLQAKTMDNLVLLVKNRNSQILKKLNQATSTLSVTCRNREMADVNYRIKCPKNVASSEAKFKVNVFVDSISYKDVQPKSFRAKDSHIELILKNGLFYLTNKTKSYVTVDSISFYHNGKIATSSRLKSELAPLSESSLTSINSLPIDRRAIEFRNLTKTKASKTKIEYGVALKYRVVNTNKENTLFKTRNYQLLSLL